MATTIPQTPKYTGDRALRSDPVNFPANAETEATYFTDTLPNGLDQTVDAMNIVVVETETAATSAEQSNTEAAQEANNSQLSADISASNANFKGNWSDATGVSSIPASYRHNDKNWQQLQNIADITTKEPQEDAYWSEIKLDSAVNSAIESISGGKLVMLRDVFGRHHLCRRFTVFTYDDLNIPNCPFTGVVDAFRRQDNSIRPFVDVPVNEMVNAGGRISSDAGLSPWVNIDTDFTRARCEELGPNFMMAGRYISAMLGWLMISNNFQPHGNTEYGRSHSHTNEFGRRADGRVPNDRNGSGVILTGTGPEQWRHDSTVFGVSNWVGNVWERDEGWKLVDGEIIVSEYMGQPEADWIATGRYINTGNQFSMTQQNSGSGNQTWNLFTKSSGYVGHDLLQRLLIEPIDCTKVLGGRFYYNLTGERFPLRSASWLDAAYAGPAAITCASDRSSAQNYFGGRFAFAS